MTYLPEWKIYLWKKLLLQNEVKKVSYMSDFLFFSQDEQRRIAVRRVQDNIDSINDMAVKLAQGVTIDVQQSKETPSKDSYFTFEPEGVLAALIELSESKALNIRNIEIEPEYLKYYQRTREKSGENLPGINAKESTDDFCGLTENLYKKIEVGHRLSVLELSAIRSLPIYNHLSFGISVNKSVLKKKLNKYIHAFMDGDLIRPPRIRYFSYEQQKLTIGPSLKEIANKYGSRNISVTLQELIKESGLYSINARNFRFYEILFALEEVGEITITDIRKEEVIISFAKELGRDKKDCLIKKFDAPTPGLSVGNLAFYDDGTLRYSGEIVKLSTQLKDLCRLFMEKNKRLVTFDDIRETIIRADKRKSTPNTTISKYVSALRNSLKIHFKKDVLISQQREGWYLDTKR
mgnify:CR=1 FL=1